MPRLRALLQVGVTALCVCMIAAGLYFTSRPVGDGIVLDRPGAPGRLVSDDITATAFFEVVGDDLELTMLFSEADDNGVFRSRVRLVDGQRHTIVVDEADGGAKRFVFRRVGYTVEMRIDPASTLNPSLNFGA